MSRSAVTILSLILTLGCVALYWEARERANPAPLYALQVQKLKTELEREQLSRLVQDEHLLELKEEVAAALPNVLFQPNQKNSQYGQRNLASVSQAGNREKFDSMMASTMFETGRSLFRKGEYAAANRLFAKLIERYGYATQATEAHFLLAEGQYLSGDLESATLTIHTMMELFPGSELTGFALIRLGQIFEQRERYDEAVQIFRTVLKTFPYRSVASQAERNLREMEP